MKEEREGASVQEGRTQPGSAAGERAESCAVCTIKLSSSTEPKLLPCLHMMCKGCVLNTSEDKHSTECPMCGQAFNLSEVTDCFIFEDSAPKCGGCDDAALSGWCKECEEALCSDCVSAHQRVKVTRNHTVIPQESQSGSSTSLRCTSHKRERLKFFCVTCEQLTCRDCQLIDHRNHSFLLLEEAVVSQKDQLMKLLDSIREQKHGVKAGLQDLDERLNDLKELKALSKKQLHNAVRSVYFSLVFQCRQLSKELEGLCDEEEKSLKVMKANLKKLEYRQEYITAFIHKILSTEGQCILQHKTQIEKWAQRVLSQKKPLPDTVIQLSLSLNEDVCHVVKKFAYFKVTRVPLSAKGKYNNGNQPKNTPEEAVRYPSGLNSGSSATLSVSDTTCIQATTDSTSQSASDLPQCRQSKPASSKPVQPTQGLTHSTSHANSSSVSHNVDPLQTTQSSTVQVGQHQSQQVFRNLSHHFRSSLTALLQSSSSVSGLRALNIIPSKLPQRAILMPQLALPQSQSGVIRASAPPPVFASCSPVAQPSVSVHTASFQSSSSNTLTNTQSHTPTSKRSVLFLLTSAPFAQSSQAISNPHPSTVNSSSNHAQQSFPQSLVGSGQCFQSPTASANKSLPSSQAVSDTQSASLQPTQSASLQPTQSASLQPTQSASLQPTQSASLQPTQSASLQPTQSASLQPTQSASLQPTQSASLQPTQSASTQSSNLQVTLLNVPNNPASLNSGPAWKVYNCAPVLTVKKGTTLSHVLQSTDHTWKSQRKSSHPTPGNAFVPLASKFSVPPANSYKELDPPVSIMPPIPTAPLPNVYSNAGQIERVTQTILMPSSELPLKAPADSVSEGDMSVCSRASPAANEADSNLPTSTVPEKDTQAEELPAVHQPRDLLSTSSIKDFPPKQSFLARSEITKSTSTLSSTGSSSTEHWLTGLPSSFSEMITSQIKVPAEDACSRSALENASLPSAKPEEDETDSDSELVKGMGESEEEPIIRQDSNKTLLVSLLRLPISGSSLSQFRIVPSSQKAEILLQEIDENQSVRRCLKIVAPPAAAAAASPSHSCSSECSLQADVLDCAVCVSAGASLQCAECDRSFHTSCHVPPILFDPIATWVCSMCQDVLDDADPFSCDRLKEPYLNLSDQRRCEQLLLSLMCEKHSYLLYKTFKQTAGCVEFNLIVGRLLGKCNPPYRSAAEMVSDLWALFDNLSNSKKKDLVVALQSSFQQRLNASFGKSLHASLLRPLSSQDQMGAPETDREKTKTTLKRMREFLAANCTPAAKKAHSENM
ncbi:E3 ubiquitin-protein ligase TRIM33 [Neoarius graeffei]|uniref:E3 ubiquitin-protein ligase TRIM33 n=1 Tax=Neoarius graeffei TaxID=443677 RepID=UPI00298C2FA5|nr:E3 ubiquitin-protein ligase TRIM33 [Neoarius graeffei]